MEKFIKIFKALSDETKLRIFLLLLHEELCVCEISNILKMEQSRVSHSLKTLKNAGLVSNRREGTWIIYYVDKEILRNNIINAIKKDMKIPSNDLKALKNCKIKEIKNKCVIKNKKVKMRSEYVY